MLGIPHHISAGDLSPALRSGLGANRVPLHDLESQPLPGRRRADRPCSVYVRTGADAQCGRGGQEAELRGILAQAMRGAERKAAVFGTDGNACRQPLRFAWDGRQNAHYRQSHKYHPVMADYCQSPSRQWRKRSN